MSAAAKLQESRDHSSARQERKGPCRGPDRGAETGNQARGVNGSQTQNFGIVVAFCCPTALPACRVASCTGCPYESTRHIESKTLCPKQSERLSLHAAAVCREAFDLFDTDGSGQIDAKELKVAMR